MVAIRDGIFEFFIQEPLKVINLWDYLVLILMKMLNFATREKEGVQKKIDLQIGCKRFIVLLQPRLLYAYPYQ